MAQHGTPPNPTVLMLTHARTASHVLQRMLSEQPNVFYGEDWFVPAAVEQRMALLQAGPIESVDSAFIQALMTALEQAYKEFCNFLDGADREGKIAVAFTQPHMMLAPKLVSDQTFHGWDATKEGAPGPWTVGPSSEAHTNPTVLPDSVLLRPGTVPIINFRHPILVCEGIFRGIRDIPFFAEEGRAKRTLAFNAHLRWQRFMYDWYLKHGVPAGIEPILLDADDYMGPDKESLMQKVCDRIPGFDAKSVIYSWSKATSSELEAMSEIHKESLQTLLASNGVLPGYDMRNRDIDTEMPKWVEKWGQEDANTLKAIIERAMPDYEYLMEHRMRL